MTQGDRIVQSSVRALMANGVPKLCVYRLIWCVSRVSMEDVYGNTVVIGVNIVEFTRDIELTSLLLCEEIRLC